MVASGADQVIMGKIMGLAGDISRGVRYDQIRRGDDEITSNIRCVATIRRERRGKPAHFVQTFLKHFMNNSQQNGSEIDNKLKAALDELDLEWVEIDGTKVKPSQCYHVDANPPHVLFNTNCPDSLKQKIQEILSHYTGYAESNEGSTQR